MQDLPSTRENLVAWLHPRLEQLQRDGNLLGSARHRVDPLLKQLGRPVALTFKGTTELGLDEFATAYLVIESWRRLAPDLTAFAGCVTFGDVLKKLAEEARRDYRVDPSLLLLNRRFILAMPHVRDAHWNEYEQATLSRHVKATSDGAFYLQLDKGGCHRFVPPATQDGEWLYAFGSWGHSFDPPQRLSMLPWRQLFELMDHFQSPLVVGTCDRPRGLRDLVWSATQATRRALTAHESEWAPHVQRALDTWTQDESAVGEVSSALLNAVALLTTKGASQTAAPAQVASAP
jgi:hypothetical protein